MISGLILAAGSSARLGRPKQLLDLGGKPVLEHVVDAALASALDEVVVVLGHRAEEIRSAVPEDERVRVVENPEHERGQSTSLAAGLRSLGPESEAAVVLLGDQPGTAPAAVAAVVAAYRDGLGPVVQASYGGRPAHPTLLARRVWAEVVAETAGDEGARSVLAARPEWRALVEVGGAPPDDIDTETDYERVRRAFEQPVNPGS
ncbi:MAG TPA: nucleotidyltransferase family protein [Actinomycetota bacterium]